MSPRAPDATLSPPASALSRAHHQAPAPLPPRSCSSCIMTLRSGQGQMHSDIHIAASLPILHARCACLFTTRLRCQRASHSPLVQAQRDELQHPIARTSSHSNARLLNLFSMHDRLPRRAHSRLPKGLFLDRMIRIHHAPRVFPRLLSPGDAPHPTPSCLVRPAASTPPPAEYITPPSSTMSLSSPGVAAARERPRPPTRL
ncbi:hypothetical protein FA95DRAFT_332504 [Auriscalpium vulgare]|uniref:Uncharacterized protein n=1 Tax=Auriscalpium vulgare TaxID=40419 RepID=A0ACB8RK58_9AGAM|nr:hypothetical protein FA95DRAFT_332504 [Auriscalpium vulgare]